MRSVAFYNARSMGYLPEKLFPELDDTGQEDDGEDVTDNWDLDSDRAVDAVDERLALGVLGGHDPAPPMPALSLDEHIRSRGLSLRKRKLITGDGNCWWHCINDLLEINPVPGVPRGHQSLRYFICDRVMALPNSSSWIEVFFENRVSAFNNFIARMKISGEFTDNYGLIPLATSLILGNK